MVWSRYRSVAISAVPVGVLVGGFLGMVVYLVANPDYRAQGGWAAFGYWLAVGAAVGGINALAGLAGGAVSMLVTGRFLRRPHGSRVLAGSLGAAVGAGVLWLVVGAVNAVVSPTGSSWFGAIVIIALAAAACALLLASLMLGRAEKTGARISTGA